MAMMRLVETICTPNNSYIQLKNDDITDSLKESFSKAGIRLNESVSKPKKEELIKDIESLRLQEGINSDILERVLKNLKEANINTSERKYYKFPIGRYGNINANNRVYTKQLWENVMSNQQDAWKGLCGLCDHPEGDSPGYFRDSSIVWLDMEIDENGLVYGIGTFVGPYGHLAQEIIDCGGRVGFSSSGFGEVGLDKVVNPNTYQIERVADIVLNPSQSVYGDNSAMNMEYNKPTPVAGTGNVENQLHESEAPKSKIVQEKEKTMVVNAIDNNEATPEIISESVINDSGLSKIEEKVFVKYVNNFLKEADEIKNPSDRLKELAEILNTFDKGAAPDLKKQVESKLIEERNKLEEMIKETVELKEEFGIDSLKEFAEDAKAIALEATYLNEENVNFKELCDKLIEHNKELKQESQKLQLKLKLRESKIDRATTEKNELSVYADSKVEELTQKLSEAKELIKTVTKENKDLGTSNNEMEKKTENLKKRLVSTLKERDELSADIKKAVEEIKVLVESSKKTSSELTSIKESSKTLASENEKLKTLFKDSVNKSNALVSAVDKLKEENAQLSKLVTTTQLKEARYKAEAELAKKNLVSYKEQVEIESTPDAHVMPRYEDRVSGYLNFRENKGLGIEAYWGDLHEKYGDGILPYERHIRGAKTLREAQAAFYRNMKFIDSDAKAADDALVSTAVKAPDRKKFIENAGYKDEREDVSDLSKVNERFLSSMPKDFR